MAPTTSRFSELRVLITRPEPEASRSAERLRQRGFEVATAPLMCCRQLPFAMKPLEVADGLILTSQRAVFALPKDGQERPVFAVGDATAEKIRAKGWVDVRSAGGDWRDLSELAIGSMPKAAHLCHLAGKQVRGELDTTLRQAGLIYHRLAVYDMRAIERLPADIVDWLQSGQPTTILFYSPATAAIWRDMPIDNRHHRAICISAACTTELQKDAWAGIAVASVPNEEALWRCLETSG